MSNQLKTQTTPKTSLSSHLSSAKEGDVIQDLENERNRIAVENKSASELFRSLLVYRICTINPLVNVAPKLIHLAEMMHCSPPVYWTIRKTFFVQFCGGETAKDCIETMDEFKGAGINSILDFAIEADLNEDDTTHPSPEEARDRLNKKADSVAQQIRTCIETASHMSKSFAAVKITSTGSPLLLREVTSTLVAMQARFKDMDHDKDGKINKEEFKQLVSMLPASTRHQKSLDTLVDDLFKDADRDQDGLVDWVDWSSTVSLNRDETRSLFIRDTTDTALGIPGLAQGDAEDYKLLLDRMEKLCEQAKESGTRLMLDAEQTYFQAAIDSVAWHLQEQYNHLHHANGPLIYCTYQMYLKGALVRLQQDVARAQRNKYVKAVKLVRGAYMVSERQRAKTLNVEDPIHANIEATHASYDAAVDFMLEVIADEQRRLKGTRDADNEGSSPLLSPQNSPVVLFVASHNLNSVIRTCKRMQELELAPQSEVVMFGQLMGMCDQISYTLGQYGYCVYKYIPYGPVQDVIPYLIRRAQENSSVLGGAGVVVERRQLWRELKGRFGASPPACP